MNKYRDELVERIKLAGHELIDRAESMVSPELNAISDFNISIYFNQGELQTIDFHTEIINRKELEWRLNKEYAKTKKPLKNQDRDGQPHAGVGDISGAV